MTNNTLENVINFEACPLQDSLFIKNCEKTLNSKGVLTIRNFLKDDAVTLLVKEAEENQHKAFFSNSTHNIYLTPNDENLPNNHIFNVQVKSSKGCITTDQIPETSPLKSIYKSNIFKVFLAKIVGETILYEYEDPLSSINVHYAKEGQELGWHFDNSSFAVTLLLQKPESGGVFEYAKNVRNSETGEMGFEEVESILMGRSEPSILDIQPGTLVLFRGKNSMHRVTPTIGSRTRFLVVFAYNSKPGVSLSKSAQNTFYGRTA